MPYEQVEKILCRARQFHHNLAQFYQRLDDTAETEDEILKMILSYLKEHEEKLEHKLMEFDQDCLKNVLDTWVQFPPAEHLDHILDKLRPEIKMSVNDLIALALRFDNALIGFYKEAAESAPTTRIQDMFENLHEEGKSERRKLVSAVFEY